MGFLIEVVRSRALPALVAALGVSFIAAGLLTYTTGTDLDVFPPPSGGIESPGPQPSDVAVLPTDSPEPTESPEPTAAPDSPEPSASFSPNPSSAPSSRPSSSAGPSEAGPASPSATPAGSAPSAAPATPKPTTKPTTPPVIGGTRVATRVVVPALEIDLPVVKPPAGSTTYPLCDVAMYFQDLSQPGRKGATYLYAHAREGMFLPLLDQSRINNGRAMLGMLVQVYTSDNRFFLYQITEVRRHQTTLTDAVAATDQELWLQTSEGPRGTPGKLQVVAMPISSGPADAGDAHPTPHPVVCG